MLCYYYLLVLEYYNTYIRLQKTGFRTIYNGIIMGFEKIIVRLPKNP